MTKEGVWWSQNVFKYSGFHLLLVILGAYKNLQFGGNPSFSTVHPAPPDPEEWH